MDNEKRYKVIILILIILLLISTSFLIYKFLEEKANKESIIRDIKINYCASQCPFNFSIINFNLDCMGKCYEKYLYPSNLEDFFRKQIDNEREILNIWSVKYDFCASYGYYGNLTGNLTTFDKCLQLQKILYSKIDYQMKD